MKNDILITGKSGFIGSRIKGGIEFTGRIEDYDAVIDEIKDVIGILHLAANSNPPDCKKDVRKTIESNLIGLLNILEVAFERNIWVLFISTYQVKKRNFYGLSKLMGEEMCRIYKQIGVNVKILRLPIVYGEKDKRNKIVTKFINLIKEGKDPNIETDEMFYFAYVSDIVGIIEKEVDVMSYHYGKKHSLYDLKQGIEQCLKNEREIDENTNIRS